MSSRIFKTYSELIKFKTFKERFEYAKLPGAVGASTFGSKRFLNQDFYHSDEWKNFRNRIIVRDEGFDLAVPNRDIPGSIYIHHLTPITIDDFLNERYDLILNENNVVCVSFRTHEAIHYSNEKNLPDILVERSLHDTCPWKK